MTAKTKITVVGLGYVGMSLAVLLARTQDVVALDIDADRVAQVNSGQPTVVDPLMDEIMGRETLSLVATTDVAEAYAGAHQTAKGDSDAASAPGVDGQLE